MKNSPFTSLKISFNSTVSFFRDHALLILIIITILVGQLVVALFFNKYINWYLLEGQMIELIWTILPAIALIFIVLL